MENKTKSERKKLYKDLLKKHDVGFSDKIIFASQLEKIGFFIDPASTKYHGNYEGGLFDHSLAVAEELINLTEKLGLVWSRPYSPLIVGLYHDLCKCGSYIKNEDGTYKYNTDQIMPGHGEKSIIIAQQYINLTDEEIACIRWHMGAYETDPKMWDYYGRAIEKYPNVLYTHMADMIASKIRGI